MKIHNAFTLGLVGTLGVGVGILILTSIESLATILTYIGAAIFIALGLDPVISWFEKKKLPRWLAIIVVFVAVAGIVAGLVFAVVPIIVDQLGQLFDIVPVLVSRGQGAWVADLSNQLGGFDVQAVIDQATKYLTDVGNYSIIASGALAVGASIANGVFGTIVVLILTLYFTASLNSIKRALYRLVPASRRERFADLSEQITDAVGRYVVGQLSLGAINFVLSYVYLSIIQAPFPAVLAFLAGMLSLIPLVGTLSGSIIIALVCLIPGLGSLPTFIAAAIYYLIYMQVEAYLLSPNIMNRAVSVPGAVVVIAALAGGTLLGILGALVAIPVAASLLLIIKQVVIPIQNER
ncbi:Predicted PurR-regulated permease PerM [Agreia bicolorata]|uniref:Predicted PurR-regulated permease PerM n=1 Tax=Agreia bicolorata TaxID=110935 RepID=A0A1T4YGX9_9MICO|nr:AI-2E family transporter [Agreia bicolorata]SKB01044.1 Predicted PurR-regulated permease PerM [Agreia bicolorata]